MRAWRLEGWGVENLRLLDLPTPTPGPGEVRLHMEATSINYRDLLTVQGLYNPKQPLPLVPGSDGCGVVEALGEGVTQWRLGDRVIPTFMQQWFDGERPDRHTVRTSLGGPLQGSWCEQMVVPQTALVAAPTSLTAEQAATLPCAALTAWSALQMGAVCAGERVLVQGTGGVSLFALQFALARGAEVVVTSSSDEKLERVGALGAHHLVNYVRHSDWGKHVATLLPGGVDHVIEVGGAGTLAQSLHAIRIGGHISLIGVLAGGRQELDVVPILMQNVRVQGVLVGHKAGFEKMVCAIDLHRIKPVISDRFDFDHLPQALAHLAAGGHMGKIAITHHTGAQQ